MEIERGTTTICKSASEAVDKLEAIYEQSSSSLREAFNAFVEKGATPNVEQRKAGCFSYPRLTVTYRPDGATPAFSRAFGNFNGPGVYQTDIARPKLFREYLIAQLEMLSSTYECEIGVSLSDAEIPYPYVLDGAKGVDADLVPPSELARFFPVPNLAMIDDKIANGEADKPSEFTLDRLGNDFDTVQHLNLFTALRTDYSLHRLQHYTGTKAEDFQSFILFTNYNRYMEKFVDLALERIEKDDFYTELVAPGGIRVGRDTENAKEAVLGAELGKYQMPAYHLVGKNGQGITLINIGVGPSNSKTITDHLAVLRPHCWIMIGHCGGLRHSQRLGDYVLAHAYLRLDGVLDEDLPPEIPVPPIAEVQQALFAAAARVTGDTGSDLKARLRTGTVVTNDDRNWELRFHSESLRFNQSRAIAIDMESATLAANGYRFRVPYGTLLCVSDKPLHGEIKLPGAANRFYERAISEHMLIGIETMELLRLEGDQMHSRKLRSFEEPPFR